MTKNTPIFEQHAYLTSIEETASAGEVVMTLNATSPSGATLIYSIMGGNQAEKFSLDFSTGKTSRKLFCWIPVICLFVRLFSLFFCDSLCDSSHGSCARSRMPTQTGT